MIRWNRGAAPKREVQNVIPGLRRSEMRSRSGNREGGLKLVGSSREKCPRKENTGEVRKGKTGDQKASSWTGCEFRLGRWGGRSVGLECWAG